MSVPYSKFGTVGADGTCQVGIGPTRAGEKWKVQRYTVTNDSSVLAPQARVYRNFVAPGSVIDVTGTGAFDTSALSPVVELGAGESLVAEWFDADVGSQCVFTLDTDTVR